MSFMSKTRRLFLKGACVLTGGIMLGVRMTGRAYAAVMQIKDCMNTRIKSVYAADDRFLKKGSQDNVQVQQMYRLYYEKPLSEKAEHELHTKWFDRSQAIKDLRAKGSYPNPRFAGFSKSPYPYEN